HAVLLGIQNKGLSVAVDLCYTFHCERGRFLSVFCLATITVAQSSFVRYSFIPAAAVAALLWERWETLRRFLPLPQLPVTYHCNTYTNCTWKADDALAIGRVF
ncbi:MAG: hypothetical protein IJI97_00605, partial [Clostridia bacterium]|nr:hypothetical protein [Clostridia bacterium]